MHRDDCILLGAFAALGVIWAVATYKLRHVKPEPIKTIKAVGNFISTSEKHHTSETLHPRPRRRCKRKNQHHVMIHPFPKPRKCDCENCCRDIEYESRTSITTVRRAGFLPDGLDIQPIVLRVPSQHLYDIVEDSIAIRTPVEITYDEGDNLLSIVLLGKEDAND